MNNPKTAHLICNLYSHLLDEPELDDKHLDLLTALTSHKDIQAIIQGKGFDDTKDSWSHKVVQQVPMKDRNSLFITDFDPERMLLSIRKSNSPNLTETLAVTINETTVFAPGFDFSVYFLNSFIFNNHEHYDGIIEVRT